MLAELDPADLRLAASAAGADVAAARSQFDMARADLARYRDLRAKNFISQAELDRHDNAYRAAESQLAAARAQAAIAANQSDYARLRAPADGVVTAVNVEPGQVVAAGQGVLQFAEPAAKEIAVAVAENQVEALRAAERLAVTLWAAPQQRYAGRLRELVPAADPVTRTYAARIAVPQANAAMGLGMTATVRVELPNQGPRWRLPLAALVPPVDPVAQPSASGAAVWRVDEASGKVVRTAVEVAGFAGNEVLIAEASRRASAWWWPGRRAGGRPAGAPAGGRRWHCRAGGPSRRRAAVRRFNISAWALEHAALTRYFMVLLLLAGLWSYFQMGQNEDPAFTFRVMVVRASLPGATALQVEEQLTDRIERKLQETPWLDKLRSYSKPGEALVLVTLKGAVPPREIPGIWYQVRKKVGDIAGTLPPGTRGPFFNDEFGDTYGSIYALSGEGYSYAELKDWVDRARQELLHVPHVSKVELFGVQDEKIYIEFSHQKFARMGITLPQVVEALQRQNAIEASGVLSNADHDVPIRVSGQFARVADVENLLLRVQAGDGPRTFRLGDFATVTRGYADPPRERMRFNGQEVIGLGIAMDSGGDIIRLGEDLAAATERIRGWLPVGIDLEQVADQPRVVKSSVQEFLRTLAEALVIVLAVSFLSLGLHRKPWRIDARPGLVVALTIPLVLAITFFFMWLAGIDFQKISLGALIIALGLLVDDAIIAVEMMVRKLEEGHDRATAASAMYDATAAPMLTGTLITVAGFMPVGFARSTAGEYTFSIFAVNAIALITSWVAAVYFTPYLGLRLLRTRQAYSGQTQSGQPHELFDTPGYRRFRALVDWCVAHRWTVIAATLLAFALAVVGFRFIPQQFFPDSNREELLVDLWLPEGASYAATEAQTRRFEAFLRRPDVAADVVNTVSWVGRGSPRFYLPWTSSSTTPTSPSWWCSPATWRRANGSSTRSARPSAATFPRCAGG